MQILLPCRSRGGRDANSVADMAARNGFRDIASKVSLTRSERPLMGEFLLLTDCLT